MIKINKNNQLREKFISKLLGLTYRLDNSGDAVFAHNGEEEFLKQLCGHYHRPITVFDIGANMGGYTDILLAQRPDPNADQFHLFEPQMSCFGHLQDRFSARPNVRINNFGLSDRAGNSTIYKDEEGSGLTSLYKRNLDFSNMTMSEEEKVELKRADEYIAAQHIQKIDLVKIDIEGHELSALNGFGEYLNGNFIDLIQFEYGGANIDSHTNLLDFYNLLLPRGFIVCKIKKHGLEIRAYHPRMDNFVYQNYVAVSKKSGLLP